jgi:hypothetical protein
VKQRFALTVKKVPLDPRQASMAATFYELVYQRLRQWHHGRTVDLLCFVHQTNEATKQLLDECGAMLSRSFRAGCFAEVWELPPSEALPGRFRNLPASLDEALSNAIGCQQGRYSASAGFVQWGDRHQEEYLHRHVPSRLLVAAQAKRGRGR